MDQVLPPLFIGIAGLGLALAVYAFWQSLRGLLQVEVPGSSFVPGSASRLSLVDEKAALLKAIKELEFERDVGKISEQDYDALNVRYRARAKQVMRELDRQLGPYRKRAVTVVAARLSGQPAAGAAKEETAPAQPGAPVAGERIVCGKCGTRNEVDAAFCKKCGGAMAEDKT